MSTLHSIPSEIITKKVSTKEFIFTRIASDENIGLKMVDWCKDNDVYTVYLETYLNMLYDEPIWNIYKDNAIILINKLHHLGIYHGSIAEDHFAVDQNKEIKLINYRGSLWIDELPKELFKDELTDVEEMFNSYHHVPYYKRKKSCIKIRNELFTKEGVSEKELLITSIASDENIGAKLVDWSKDLGKYKNKYTIHLEKYPYTLDYEPNLDIYKYDAIMLINKLHKLGIYHGDIKKDNFVVDPNTKEIKLIDYGESCWISEFPEIEVKDVEWLFDH